MAYLEIIPNAFDLDNTFGKLQFQRVKYQKYHQDDEGNDILTDVIESHIDVKSSVQKGSIAIVVDGDVEKTFEYGDRIELIDPEIEAYAIPQDTSGFVVNTGFSIKAKGLKKVAKQQATNPLASKKN